VSVLVLLPRSPRRPAHHPDKPVRMIVPQAQAAPPTPWRIVGAEMAKEWSARRPGRHDLQGGGLFRDGYRGLHLTRHCERISASGAD
jgi:hypothetical protein